MPAPRPILGLNDLHLIAKVLDLYDHLTMARSGLFTALETARATRLFEQMDEFLDETLGEDWNDQEALV